MRGRIGSAFAIGVLAGAGVLTGTLLPAAEEAPKVPALQTLLREKSIYIPYDKLLDVYEKEGRGIFLPYEEFLKLWRAAQRKPGRPPEPEPPRGAVVRSGFYVGEVKAEAVRFTATYAVEALKKGWSECPLNLGEVAVESIESSDKRLLVERRSDGYRLLVPGPGSYEVKIAFAAPVVRVPGRKSFSFKLPPLPVSRLEITIPERNVRVDLKPLVVASTSAAGEAATKVLAFLGQGDRLQVSWMPAAGKQVEERAVALAWQQVRAHLGERILRITTAVHYEILRGALSELLIKLPQDMRLLSIKGQNVRQWRREGEVLKVALHSPLQAASGGGEPVKYDLELELEKILQTTPDRLTIRFPQVEEVIRESGWVVFSHVEDLKVRVQKAEGLSQVDISSLPTSLRRKLGVGYRYLAHPISLTVGISKILPVVRAETTSVVCYGTEEDKWIGWIEFRITKAGLFKLKFQVPERWSVLSIGQGTTVEDFQTTKAGALQTVEVTLSSKAMGSFRLPFTFTAPGSAAEGERTAGPPRVLEVKQDRGLFAVAAPTSFSLTTVRMEGLVAEDVEELFKTGIMTRLGRDAGIPLTYRYRRSGGTVTVKLEAKKTEINVLAQHLLEISDAGVTFTHILDYEILYAPVDRVRFEAPQALDTQLNVEAEGKKELRKVETKEGISTWELVLQAPRIGGVSLTVRHQVDLKALEAGKPFRLSAPLIRPVDARELRGYAALRKEGTLEVSPEARGMEAVEVSDLPDKLRRGSIYAAFRYFGEKPGLSLRLTRYEFQPLATTVISLLHFEGVLSEERRLKARASFIVQNSERQYLEITFPQGTSIFSLKVAGKTAQPRRRREEEQTRLIPIPVSTGPKGAFPVVVDYEQVLPEGPFRVLGGVSLVLPKVGEGVPVNKIEAALYLPPEYVPVNFGGTLKARGLPADSLWAQLRNLAGESQTSRSYRRAEQSRRSSAGAGLSIEVPTGDYVKYSFASLAPEGTLSFWYFKRNLWRLLELLLFAGALGCCWFLIVRLGFDTWPTACAALFVPLLLLWYAEGPAVDLAGWLFAGSALFFVGLGATRCFLRFKSWRESRGFFAKEALLGEESAGPGESERGTAKQEGKGGGGKRKPPEENEEKTGGEEEAGGRS